LMSPQKEFGLKMSCSLRPHWRTVKWMSHDSNLEIVGFYSLALVSHYLWYDLNPFHPKMISIHCITWVLTSVNIVFISSDSACLRVNWVACCSHSTIVFWRLTRWMPTSCCESVAAQRLTLIDWFSAMSEL
jgi:hypothetical protein